MDKELEPFVFYNGDGDECEVFITSDDYYGQWINPHLTIYYKEGDEKQVVGLCIHNIIGLIDKEKDMKNEVCHKCGHPVTEDCISERYCTRCGESIPEGAVSHAEYEKSRRPGRSERTLFEHENVHDCFYSPESGWFEHLEAISQMKARQWADEMAEWFACHIREGTRPEISIPRHWMVPHFADKVLSHCTQKGIHYTKI